MERFKPESRAYCTCTWCKKEVDAVDITVYAKEYEKRPFNKIVPTNYFQLCPTCYMKLREFSMSIIRRGA